MEFTETYPREIAGEMETHLRDFIYLEWSRFVGRETGE